MSDIIVVTNSSLCTEDFLQRIDKLASEHPKAIILREKTLEECAYLSLANKVLAICRSYNTPCILHSFYSVAKKLEHSALHLPLNTLRLLSDDERACFQTLGASCHSLDDALEAEKLGCTYITAGHIFNTDCKKGLPGRGLDFLAEITAGVNIPVYAIGGINKDNIGAVRSCGAAGACVMSSSMTCSDVSAFFKAFEEVKNEV